MKKHFMKKHFILFLSLICALSLFGCDRHKDNGNAASLSFAEFLDNENFITGANQSDFFDCINKYSLDGKSLFELGMTVQYDRADGGGSSTAAKGFGFSDDYSESEDGKTAIMTNRFHTKGPIDGLTLPHGITFDDTLTDVLQKLGIKTDCKNGFVSDKDNKSTMTLQSDSSSSLKLTDLFFVDAPIETEYRFELKYTENYKSVRKDGRTTDVTRYVLMSFSGGDSEKLEKFEMFVCGEFAVDKPRMTEQGSDSGENTLNQ